MFRLDRRCRALAPLLVFFASCGGESDPAATTGGGPPADPCAAHAFRDDASMRVFAVQPKVAPEHFESYASYDAWLRGLVDAQVKPCLAKDRPNVIAFPEDVGLPAIFVGSRGGEARAQPDITSAFLALPPAYSSAVDHYTLQWPDLAVFEGVFLGATDTIYRALIESSAAIAKETGAWVITSTNVSGAVEKSTDPADLAALADPDLPGAGYVYVAKDRAVYNTAFVIAPSGEIVGRAKKPYPVISEEQYLLFTPGPLNQVAPIEIEGVPFGVLTSKDAWMPDVVDRLDALGARVFVQPEAFSGWTIEELPGDWLPDVFRQSGWAATQKHGGYRYAVIPHLTGNLFDQIFDGQSAIVGDAIPGETRRAYVGQEPQGGFLAVAPWAMEDPGVAEPSLSLEARREALRAKGNALLPIGKEPNGYVAAVVGADIDPAGGFPIEAAGPPGALGPSRALAESSGEERCTAIASDGEQVVIAVWQDDRDGRPQIYAARSTDGGGSFGAAKPVAASPNAQRAPSVVVTGASVYAAWQEGFGEAKRIVAARSSDGGASFGGPIAVGPAGMGPADDWGAALAASGDRVYVAFVAFISGNERVVVARTLDGSDIWEATVADGGAPKYPAGNIRNNQWAPAIAASGDEVVIAWTDFRDYNWDVFLARSTDAGQSFAPAARVDDGGDAPERIHDDPALLFAPGGALLAGWSDVRLRRAPAKARAARATGGVFGASAVLGGAPEGASAWRPRFAKAGAKVVAVWQDFRSLGNDVHLATSADDGATWAAEKRVDDGGDGPSYQFAPRVVEVKKGNVMVAWEDTRSGRRQLRYAVGAP